MKLVAISIFNYQSIRDTGRFEVGDITCLVGKNEAGKTAILKALYRLNPIIPEHGTFDITDDYPRSEVEDYQQSVENGEREHANVIEAEFALEDQELTGIYDEFGQKALKEPKLILKKGYDNELYFILDPDQDAITTSIVMNINLPSKLSRKLSKAESISRLIKVVDDEIAELTEKHQNAVEAAQQIEDEKDKIRQLGEAEKTKVPSSLVQLQTDLAKFKKQNLRNYIWATYLSEHLPKFLYFDDYFQMEGHVNIDTLMERQTNNTLLNSDRPMLGLVDLARLDLQRLISPKNTQDLVNKLEGASNYLSSKVLKYWSQNDHLHMEFDIRQGTAGDPEGMQEGMNLWASVRDNIHMATTRLATRSRGFRWFFSFLAFFSQYKKKQQPLILLLDEPGLFLHGSAQGDLLRYLEVELKPDHQIIYTTHSPFMVDPSRFDRVRIVEDKSIESSTPLPKEEQGSKILTEVLHASDGSLFPLQHALGYEITQTLFVGPYCLIVEGVSDLLYLQIIISIMGESCKTTLDSRWTITPVGGIDKVPTFVALLGSQSDLKIAVLLDIARSTKDKVEDLYKSKLLKKNRVLTLSQFTDKRESDIEDMFETEFYLKLFNSEFERDLNSPILQSNLLQSRDIKILTKISKYLEKCPLKRPENYPLKRGVKFNHFRPARYLVENCVGLKNEISQSTFERFESLFETLNGML